MSQRNGGYGNYDIYKASMIDGRFQDPENLGNIINTAANDYDPCISPDESFLIFASDGRENSLGGIDLFITFRLDNGSWATPLNMGERINSSGHDVCPYLSPDGNYFFFTSSRKNYKNYSETNLTYEDIKHVNLSSGNGRPDIYWVDAKIIEELRPKE